MHYFKWEKNIIYSQLTPFKQESVFDNTNAPALTDVNNLTLDD
jgi:hypothetical protein